MNIPFKEFLKEVSVTIVQQKRRSLLSLYGVFNGILLLCLTLSAGMGFEGGIIRQLLEVESNTVAVTVAPTTISYNGFEKGRNWHLDDSDIEFLKTVFPDEIKKTVPLSHFPADCSPVPVSSGINSKMASIIGVTADFTDIIPQKIIYGRAINMCDCCEMRKVCVLGEDLAKSLFGTADVCIGEIVRIAGAGFTVVGVVRKSNPILNFGVVISDDIFLPITSAGFLFDRIGEYDTAACVLNSGFSSEEFTPKFDALVRNRHCISPVDNAALATLDLNNYYGMFINCLKALRLLIWIVGVGTLLTGLIGISNIMMISVIERSREIGIRLSCGATLSSVMSQILCESLFITMAGGLSGIVVGGWLVFAISKLINATDSSIIANMHIPFWTITASLIILVAGGLVAGYLPARKAMSVDIVETFKDE